jgi:hypothetical protein
LGIIAAVTVIADSTRSLLEPVGNILSAETGENDYAILDETCIAA